MNTAKPTRSPYTTSRLSARVFLFTRPILMAKRIMRGTWNTTPKPSMKFVTMVNVCPMDSSGEASEPS
jgi:hypothetical protein